MYKGDREYMIEALRDVYNVDSDYKTVSSIKTFFKPKDGSFGFIDNHDTMDTKGVDFENHDDYVELTPTGHGEWHEVFRFYLELIGKSDMYMKSIGGTLERLPRGVKLSFDNFKFDYATRKAELFLEFWENTEGILTEYNVQEICEHVKKSG